MKNSDKLEALGTAINAVNLIYIEGDNPDVFSKEENKEHRKNYKNLMKMYGEIKREVMKPTEREKEILGGLMK